MLKNFTDLLERVKSIEPRTVSVAVAQDEAVMSAVRDAAKIGFIKPVLVGDGAKIREIGEKIGFTDYELVDCPDEAEAMKTAVELVRNKKSRCSDERDCQYSSIYARCTEQRIRSAYRQSAESAGSV